MNLDINYQCILYFKRYFVTLFPDLRKIIELLNSIPGDYLLSYIALNVLFMTHKAATWIISRKALSPFIDPHLQSSQ